MRSTEKGWRELAKTNAGIEFYLVEIVPGDATFLEEISELFNSVIRTGDAVFEFEGRLYVALAASVRGSGQATRRFLRVGRERGLDMKIRMVQEPFPETLWNVAARVVVGEVAIAKRAAADPFPNSRL